MKTSASKRQLTPQTAGNDKQLARLNSDRVQTKHCSFMVDGKTVSFLQQRNGGPLHRIEIPKVEFDRMVKFYLGEGLK